MRNKLSEYDFRKFDLSLLVAAILLGMIGAWVLHLIPGVEEDMFLKQILGEAPVLFLDDVMSELDTKRQSYLLNNLDGYQVFITCCEPESLKLLKEGSIFLMKSGRIMKG